MNKERHLQEYDRLGKYYDSFVVHEWDIDTHYDRSFLDTTNHPKWKQQDDASGYFSKATFEYYRTLSEQVQIWNGINLAYDGRFSTNVGFAIPEPIGDGHAYGVTAYDRMKPTKPDWSLYNFIYELRDLPHMILQLDHAFQNLLSIGDWANKFLGQIFGWNPLISDVLKVIEKQQAMQKRIEWLIQNNGRWVKRRVNLAETQQTLYELPWTPHWGSFEQVFTTQFYNTVPEVRQHLEYYDRVWATAEFRYFLPDVPPGVKLEDRLKSALNGSHSIRAYQLYDMIPWTWLIGWCLDASTILKNLDAGIADRLAARRFVIMRTQYYRGSQWAQGNFRHWPTGSNVSVNTSSFAERHLKTRVVGAPFFPSDPEDLTGMQYAILGALGLSRYKK